MKRWYNKTNLPIGFACPSGRQSPSWAGGLSFLAGKIKDRGMPVKLYVGNLAFTTTADDLRVVFAQAGSVASIDLITDRDTGQGITRVRRASSSATLKPGVSVHWRSNDHFAPRNAC